MHGGVSNALKLEFSIPKLLYGNNFQEVQDCDFSDVVSRLNNVLVSHGVLINNPKVLENAFVVEQHFSRNFVLDHKLTVDYVLEKLGQMYVPKYLDYSKQEYRNGGSLIKFHSNSREIVFYDKGADLKQSFKSDKRAEENSNLLQKHLYEIIHYKRLQVLREEIRLKGARTVRKYTGIQEPTFDRVFSKDISNKVLIDSMNTFVPVPISMNESSTDLFHKLQTKFKGTTNLNFQRFAYAEIVRDRGFRGASTHLAGVFSERKLAQFRKELSILPVGNTFDPKQWLTAKILGEQNNLKFLIT
jgi:hypothetical protein